MAASNLRYDPASLWLRLAVSGFCVGWSAWILYKLGTQMGAWALFFGQIEHGPIAQGERTLAWFILLCAAMAWIPGRAAALAGLVGIFAFTESLAGTVVGGYSFSHWTLPAHALRWLTPLALAAWILLPADAKTGRGRVAFVLRLAVATVFATHGLEAILRHPGFEDFIIGTVENAFGLLLDENQIYPLLLAIGLLDLFVAVAILLVSWRALFAWLALWGLVTALARMTTYGTGAWPELFLRTPHFCVPFALWALSRATDRSGSLIRFFRKPTEASDTKDTTGA